MCMCMLTSLLTRGSALYNVCSNRINGLRKCVYYMFLLILENLFSKSCNDMIIM